MINNNIIELVKKVHSQHWQLSGDEGTGDKLAKRITDEWQLIVSKSYPDFKAEVHISDDLRERVDLVDMKNGIAYELKVSPNNSHFEFYRDIFKIVMLKKKYPFIKQFVFLVPQSAANKLLKGMGGKILSDTKILGFETVIIGL